MTTRRLPGRRWRTLAHERGVPVKQADRGTFDELVIDSWFHLEQMGDRSYWMRVAGIAINVTLATDGSQVVSAYREKSGRLEMLVDAETVRDEPWWGPDMCKKRPNGRRCVMVAGHDRECIPAMDETGAKGKRR